jgi:2-polyprenyl-3-methyl-5-hydroxy-6-metoxy-1,4-benzoquinol methylase
MSAPRSKDYVLGHSDAELRRLEQQGRFFGDLTALIFRAAGLREGMRVLDVGCGAGDVSLLAARFVGTAGAVLGVDRSEEAVAVAGKRAQASGAENVTFVTGDAAELQFDTEFDAVVGRLVVMYHPRPSEMLRHLSSHVRAGGLLVFHEIDAGHLVSEPRVPLFERMTSWIVQTLQVSGADPIMGLRLRLAFVNAGLPAPQMIVTGRVDGGPDSPAYEVLTSTLRALLPAAEQYGIIKADEVQIDTLASRLRDEVVAGGGVILPPLLIGAWTTKPD